MANKKTTSLPHSGLFRRPFFFPIILISRSVCLAVPPQGLFCFYRYSTSNHNLLLLRLFSTTVIFYRYSTSNHNC